MYHIKTTLHMTLCSVSSGTPHNVLELFGAFVRGVLPEADQYKHGKRRTAK